MQWTRVCQSQKFALDAMLGYVEKEEDYFRYFDLFQKAQRKHGVTKHGAKSWNWGNMIKSKKNWEEHYGIFLSAESSKNEDLMKVKDFKRILHPFSRV
jgi:hypothetical protein